MVHEYAARGLGLVATCIALSIAANASAHEPVFSPGPHTIFEGGFATSASSTFQIRKDAPTSIGLNGGVVYGVTADLDLSAGVPVAVARNADHGPSTAVGDPVVQAKWRPWKVLTKGQIDSLSLIGGVKLPAGHHDVSDGNTGYTLGATIAREHQRYYLFGSATYTTQTVGKEGTKPGDVFEYNLVTGLRPVVLEYDQPDPVLLVEFNGTTSRPSQGTERDETHGTLRRPLNEQQPEMRTRRQAHSGGPAAIRATDAAGTEFAVAPELLLSWGPVMLKSGVQIPFFDTYDDAVTLPAYRLKTDLIVQF